MRTAARALFSLMVASGLAGCATTPPGTPVLFERAPVPTDVPPDVNWPHAPLTTLQDLQTLDGDEVVTASVEGAGAGVTGARKVTLALRKSGETFIFKGKPAPSGSLDGFNNSPRKELAAYWIQTLFLDPVDFVVPFSAMRCIPLELWNRHEKPRPPTVEGTACVLANVSTWLQEVTVPDTLYDRERFLRDPNYAYHLAHFNLLTYLIQGKDSRKGNVLVSVHDEDRRVFAIDNGVSFGDWMYNWFVPETYAWQHIRVPALPKRAVERLRGLEREDLDTLATVQQMQTDDAGILRIVAPEPPLDPDEGARIRGDVVQFGLTRREIDAVWERIVRLLARIDTGEIGTF